jgi:glutamate dehydrogenase
MEAMPSDDRQGVVEHLRQYAVKRMAPDQARLFLPLAERYYERVAAEDLVARAVPDLFGAALAHLRLARHRTPGQAQVAVFSPTFDEHGFASPHTVVQVVTDDMPFLPDSLTTELSRHGFGLHIAIHPVFVVERSAAGELLAVLDDDTPAVETTSRESFHHIEIDRQADAAVLEQLRLDLIRVLGDVRAANEDQTAMRERAVAIAESLDADAATIPDDDREEAAHFLRWLADDHFTFLGYREYEVVAGPSEQMLQPVAGSGLGILRYTGGKLVGHALSTLPSSVSQKNIEPPLLNLTKANSRATVQRGSYLDYIGIRRFDAHGTPVGERRFLGLYPKGVAKQSLFDIPIVRRKMRAVLDRAADPRHDHEAHVLVDILDSYPRDELLQSEVDDLYSDAIAILELQHRQRLRLRVRRDGFERFFSCFVDLPLGRLTEAVRVRVRETLMAAFHGVHAEESTLVTDSSVARLHFVIYTRPGTVPDHDTAMIEAWLASTLRTWTDDLADALVEGFGEERGLLLYHRYANAMPSGYQDDHTARTAVSDIRRLETLLFDEAGDGLALHLYRPHEAIDPAPRLKLYRSGEPLTLSGVLPLLENMGTKVIDERPYEIRPADADPVWIYDFGLHREALAGFAVADVRERFEETFAAVWRGEIENDRFNRLVLCAGLRGSEATVIRAYVKYLRQVGATFSRDFMAATIVGNPEIASLLVSLFAIRFDPDFDRHADRSLLAKQAIADIEGRIDQVESLNEDRVLRSLLRLATATLRTNSYQPHAEDGGIPRLALKLDSRAIPDLPHPRPMFEIFVYSPRVEGVHLRGGTVARGGLRWSDRPEDFRTEILGLAKAQTVKNAVIVPVGAKGGFVVKAPPLGRDALYAEVASCYRTFVRGLLDVTDNMIDGRVVPPERVVRHDGDDPYLVVAADKGTATFSDMANAVSSEYAFWLGDAFASGGSKGYDHKVMGITARGAWVSVRRHFRALGVDVQNEDFTVVGVGDMSGDVFGNGMLLSRHIRLVAAFDHRHVFLDPDPDPARGFEERSRLFALPRSSWADYDPAAISPGGGVFLRSAKSVPLSDEIREALDVDAEALPPDDLIRAILRAPVDLLWNGGVGTYVKATTETNADVGDKNNDAVRIDATELRCRVVGEGGNLGLTQRARIEFAHGGGHINTDAIDNAAGVNCSDNEVNIKILLDGVVRDGDLTAKQRDTLLASMTAEVATQVLSDNDGQTRALYIAAAQANAMCDVHVRYLDMLEHTHGLNRALEQLPTGDELRDRASTGGGLTMPEFAVVLAYSKIALFGELLESDLPEDPFFGQELQQYFPEVLGSRYSDQIREHPLRREIIATRVTNRIVDRAGTTFVFRLAEETGMAAPEVARAQMAAREIFGLPSLWTQITELDDVLSTDTQINLLLEARRLAERATRWLLRNRSQPMDVAATIMFFEPGARELALLVPDLVTEDRRRTLERTVDRYISDGVPEGLARAVGTLPDLVAALDIATVARSTGRPVGAVAEVYFALDEYLKLDWLRGRILDLPRDDRWQALARAALREDLHAVHSAITAEVVQTSPPGSHGREDVHRWVETIDAAAIRCLRLLGDIITSGRFDLATLSVALREIRSLAHASTPESHPSKPKYDERRTGESSTG